MASILIIAIDASQRALICLLRLKGDALDIGLAGGYHRNVLFSFMQKRAASKGDAIFYNYRQPKYDVAARHAI